VISGWTTSRLWTSECGSSSLFHYTIYTFTHPFPCHQNAYVFLSRLIYPGEFQASTCMKFTQWKVFTLWWNTMEEWNTIYISISEFWCDHCTYLHRTSHHWPEDWGVLQSLHLYEREKERCWYLPHHIVRFNSVLHSCTVHLTVQPLWTAVA